MLKIEKEKNNSDIIVAYIPVLHEGYRRFFDNHKEAKGLFLIGNEIAQEFVPLRKDLRALPAEIIKKSLESWGRFDSIEIVQPCDWEKLAEKSGKVVMPDEDVMRELQLRFLPKAKIIFDSIFLRWDKHKSSDSKAVAIDQTISIKDSDQSMVSLLKAEAEKSSDFWRHIGAAIVKDGRIILQGHNHHVPNEQMPYVNGDPRSDFHKGVNLELSTAIHAEASLIAEAAKEGIALEGTEMYATTFPCPPCAKLIAYSGIKKLYYADGYDVLDAASILKSRGVEIIFVKTENNDGSIGQNLSKY